MKKYIIFALSYSVSMLFGCTGDQPCPLFDQNVPAVRATTIDTRIMPNILQNQPTQNKSYSISIYSEALKNSKIIPARYTCDGENVSPDIRWMWNGIAPMNIKSYAILVTSDEWIGVNLGINPRAVDQSHWVVFNIPSTVTELQEGAKINGSNGMELRNYQGPRCSMLTQNKTSPSTYAFTVYALDTVLDSDTIRTKDDLVAAIQGHIIASNSMQKTYVPAQK